MQKKTTVRVRRPGARRQRQQEVITTTTTVPKRRNVRRRNRNRRGGGGNSPAMLYGKSVVNPWGDQHCVPDAALRTGCVSNKSIINLTTGAGGTCSLLYCPSVDYHSFYSAPAGANFSFPAASLWSNSNQTTTYSALYSSYRPVSSGIRLNYTGSTTADQGVVIVGFLNKEVAADILDGTNTNVVTLLNDYTIIPLKSCVGREITWRPDDESDSADFIDILTNATGTSFALNNPTVPYSSIFVGVLGAAASANTLQFEAITTWQCKIRNATAGVGVMHVGPPESGWYEKAARIFGVISRVATVVPWSQGSSIARQITQSMAPMVLGSILPRGNQRRLRY